MRSRDAQVDRIEAALRAVIPCYRSPDALVDGRVGRDGKVYPAGARWEWRRIALRREAVGAVLHVDPGASVRVARDVLARYGHRVSHEQVRTDIAFVTARPIGLAESRRWLPLEAWLGETERRRRERARSASTRRSVPSAATREVDPTARGPRGLEPPSSTASPVAQPAPDDHPDPLAPPRPLARSAPRPADRPADSGGDWAVWNVPSLHSRSR